MIASGLSDVEYSSTRWAYIPASKARLNLIVSCEKLVSIDFVLH